MEVDPEYTTANDGAMLESKVKLLLILGLPMPEEAGLHLQAKKKYIGFLIDLMREAPCMYLIREDDLQLFLSDGEYTRLRECEEEVNSWLLKCRTDNDGATLEVDSNDSPSSAMLDMKKLLAKATSRTVLSMKRLEALKEIKPPFSDAEKHLNGEEWELFRKSLSGAADAYLDGGEGSPLSDWHLDGKARDYRVWTHVIDSRKEKEANIRKADVARNKFLRDLNRTIKKYIQNLAKKKPAAFGYPSHLASYQMQKWFDFDFISRERVENWAAPVIKREILAALQDYVTWDLSWKVRPLLQTKYEFIGVPCLTWGCATMVTVKADLAIKPMTFTKNFYGYDYRIGIRHVELGCLHLGPADGGCCEGFSTPIALLQIFAKGDMEAPGIQVLSHGLACTTFSIQGFEEETAKITNGFRKFIGDTCKGQPLAAALLAKNIIDADTAKLVDAKSSEPLPLINKSLVSGEDGPQEAIDKLMELGWSQADAAKAVEGVPFPKNASVDDIVKVIQGEP